MSFDFDIEFDGEAGGSFSTLAEGEYTMIPAVLSPRKTQKGDNMVSIDYICVEEGDFGASLRMQRNYLHTEGSVKRTSALFGSIRDQKFRVRKADDFAKNLFGWPVKLTLKMKPDMNGVDRLEVDGFRPVTDAEKAQYLELLRNKSNLAKIQDEIERLTELSNEFAEKYDQWISDFHAPYYRDAELNDAPEVIGSFNKDEYRELPAWVRVIIPAKPIIPKASVVADTFDDGVEEDIPF